MALKKLRLESNGKFNGTRVYDAETGEDLSGYFTDFTCRMENGRVILNLTAAWAEIDVTADRVELDATDRTGTP